MTLTLEQLRALLLEYDRSNIRYPEHEYEGFAVFEFLRWKLENIDPSYDNDAWEQEMKS